MRKRHQASRRRTYGRRQHELHQRPDLHETERHALAGDRDERAEGALVALPFRGRPDRSIALGFAD